jgi:molybdopterin converting factor small subunit
VGIAEVKAAPGTPKQVVLEIATNHPSIRKYFLDADGDVRESLAFFKNGRQVPYDEKVPDAAELEIIPQISGG